MKFVGFAGGAYSLADRKLAYQECINFYPENDTLQPTGGYEDLIELEGDGKVRALYRTSRGLGETDRNANGDVIAVVGSSVMWYKPDLNEYETLGVITNILNTVSIADDGNGIVIADGEQMYRIDMNSLDFSVVEFTEIKPRKVVVLNFRTIVIGYTTDDTYEYSNRFYYSDNADNSTFDALSYFELKDVRAPILSMEISNGLLWLYSTNVRQAWQTNSNNTNKPFVFRTSGVEDAGLSAVDSTCSVGGQQYFVGSYDQGSPMVFQDDKVISNTALNKELSGTDVSLATSFVLVENGHVFIVFNFPSLDKTYVYDTTNGEWHRRTHRNDLGENTAWKPYFVINWNGTTIMGSITDNKLYTYSNSITTQSDGGEILRLRTSPNLINESRVISYNRLNINCRVGEGLENNSTPPQLMVRYSNDGGYTWSSRITTDVGSRGEYSRDVEIRKLGRGKQFMIEVSISDSNNLSIHEVDVFNNVSGARG